MADVHSGEQLTLNFGGVPNSAKYADPAFRPNVKPHTPSKARQMLAQQQKKESSQFDSRMIQKMDAAGHNRVKWEEIFNILVNAATQHSFNNLRSGVAGHFIATCPFAEMVAQFKFAIS